MRQVILLNIVCKEDGTQFRIPIKIVRMLQILDKFLPLNDEDVYYFNLPPINVPSNIFQLVLEFCHHYQNVEIMDDIQRPTQSSELKTIVTQEWYYNFISKLDQNTLFRLVNAATYLGVESLLNLAVLALAIRLHTKDAEEVKNILNISSESHVKRRARRKIF